MNVRELVYWMAKKQDKLTRKDMANAAKKRQGAAASMGHASEAGPMSSHIKDPTRRKKAVGPPTYTSASALLNLVGVWVPAAAVRTVVAIKACKGQDQGQGAGPQGQDPGKG